MEENRSSGAFSTSSSFESLSAVDLESAVAFPFPRYNSFSYRRGVPGPRSPRGFFLSDDDEGAHHFLDSCHLCKKPIAGGRDIYMYRGDTPFCSEECRQEQIEMDEGEEKRLKIAQKQQQKSKNATSPSKSEKIHVRVTGTVVAG